MEKLRVLVEHQAEKRPRIDGIDVFISDANHIPRPYTKGTKLSLQYISTPKD
jgi:hypothetical protein